MLGFLKYQAAQLQTAKQFPTVGLAWAFFEKSKEKIKKMGVFEK